MSTQAAGGAPDPIREAWGAVVPAKPLRTAKSRLAELGDDVRRDLVVSFLHDTVAAIMSARSVVVVVVVTDDATLASAGRSLGAWSVPDDPAGLNASLAHGAAEVLRRVPDVGVLASCADLPALTGNDLDHWLSMESATASAFVADAAGTGTTMLRSADLGGFTPAFGVGSRSAHARMGMSDLTELAAPGLRHDVDTPADLSAAAARPIGERTRWVLAKHRL